jgi:Terminase large subunit, T4likevirus-type, N-terminal
MIHSTSHEIHLRPPQWTVFTSDARFRILVAGRRFGKTYLSLVELCRAAWAPGRLAWYVGPTYKQAKRVAWRPLKQMTRPYWAFTPNETDLRIELVTGGTICLRGADHYDSLRGDGLDFLILDEYASIARQAWPEVLRPALADKQGRALLIGTPRGHNHFYDLYQEMKDQPDWATFQFTTEQGGNVAAEELLMAARQLDVRTYRQEFQASFEIQGVGIVYYAFDRQYNVRPLRYDPKLPLFWALDFNTNPFCSVLGQVCNGEVHVLKESILPDSHTEAACEQFLESTREWTTAPPPPPLESIENEEVYNEMLRQLQPPPLNLYVYGDATGVQRKTSASRTDWQIVKNFLSRYTDRFHASFHVPSANPAVKDRTNCMNAVLRSHAGLHRLFIDPQCKHLIKDFEQVSWKADPYGNPLVELDKSDPLRTHVSDALGYMIACKFPMRRPAGERAGPLII